MQSRYGYRTARLLVLTAALGLCPLAQANAWTLLKGHTGAESEEDLDWYGLTVGWYTGSWKADRRPAAQNAVQRFLNREAVHAGVDLTVAAVDDDRLSRTRYDVSVVPKIRYYLGRHLYWSLGIGVAYNELEEESTDEAPLRLGSKLFFAPEASAGVEFGVAGAPLLAELYFTHRSNAGLGDSNQGLNFLLFAVGTRLGAQDRR